MSFIGKIVIIMLCCILGACAIHPLPENVTGVKTAQIVHRNRCEAQTALIHITNKLSSKHHNPPAITELNKMGMVMSYSLLMSETDNLTVSTTFEGFLRTGSASFNPNGFNNLSRQNTRTFTVADNYETLMRMKQCDLEPVGRNYEYPIVGTIGIAEMIKSFLTMALHEDLTDSDEKPSDPPVSTSIAGAPNMVDTLLFTTTVSAGINPMVTLTPVGRVTQLTGASANAVFQREDAHTVIIGLGLPEVVAPEGATHTYKPYSISSLGRGNSGRNRTPLLIDASVPSGGQAPTGISVAMEATNNEVIRRDVFKRGLIATGF